MNELLKELLPNPYMVDYQVPHDGRGFDLYDERKMIEYGQRIVRECIDCINETDKGYVFTAQDAGVIGAAHNRSIKTIKEHFGVEE